MHTTSETPAPRYVSRSDHSGYPMTDRRYVGDDGGLLDLEFEPRFLRANIAERQPSMWRYREALPLDAETAPVTLGEGFTPLVPVSIGAGNRSGAGAGIGAGSTAREVLIKQEQLFPSGSYKDRGAAMLISHAKAIGVSEVVEDSSGNAGAAVAAYCARADIRCRIFAPADTSPGKLAQIRSYGAELVLTPGPREETARAILEAARDGASEGVFYASHSYNPFFFHGTKTFAYEIWEQLGWTAPDALVVPAGNGTLLLGAAIGFAELLSAGEISRLPRLYAVQAARCAPLAEAVAKGNYEPAGPLGNGWSDHQAAGAPEPTVAEGIAIATPIRGDQIIEAVRESGGAFVAVDEEEIHLAHRTMSRAGFCIEPTSAATIAGVPKAYAMLPEDAVVVSLFSGHGLKASAKLPVD